MKILAVTGASGGHIFPALSFLNSFNARESIDQILLVLPSRSKKLPLDLNPKNTVFIESVKLSSLLSRDFIKELIKVFKSFLQGLRIFFDFKPDIVVGFGSIDSVFLVMLAWFLRVKTVIHEQNVIPGKANILLARFADKVCISFFETSRYLSNYNLKTALTGNPIRQDLISVSKQEARGFFGIDENRFTILVMGGSQGSEHINRVFQGILKSVHNKEFQVIHITGNDQLKEVESNYRELGIKAVVFSFLKKVNFAFCAADIALTRSGATTISELIYFKLPAVMSPYPFAGKHQLENAMILEQKGCAVIVKDSDLDSQVFADVIKGLIGNYDKINLMRCGYKSFPESNAAEKLKEAVLSVY